MSSISGTVRGGVMADGGDKPIRAWHFLRPDGKLQFKPHRKVKAGQTLLAKGKLSMCKNGLHASKNILDALRYAPGPIICRVELSGEILHDSDKMCARKRTCLELMDGTQILHLFACWCAERALRRERKNGHKVDKRSSQAVYAKRRWLRGEINDAELAAARAAAWSAAEAAARAAAWSAAEATAWSAAEATAWSAAKAAAGSAEQKAQKRRLMRMVWDAFRNQKGSQ